MEYLNLEDFENKVMKLDEKNKEYYILSPSFYSIYNYRIKLSHISIFDKKERGTIEKDKETVKKILNILKNKDLTKEEKGKELNNLEISDLEKKSIGSIMGMAIGDAMGSTYEFHEVDYEKIDLFDMSREKEGAFQLEPGQWTDDTSMGLCLADSLLVNNGELDPHDLLRRFLSWNRGGYNNAFRFNEKYNLMSRSSVGLGGNISWALAIYPKTLKAETIAGDKFTSGNDSIMRNAAIPICFNDSIEKAQEMARKQSLTTHQGLEAKECCSLLTFIIVKIFKGEDLKKILENLGTDFKTNEKSVECLAKSIVEEEKPDRDWNWKKKDYRYHEERAKRNPGYIGSYAMDNLAMSLHIVYHTGNFRDAIVKAVNLRGDSDSVASVVGQIAGAYYPIEDIPIDWIECINKWDDEEIALRGYMLSRIHSKKSFYDKK